MNWFNSTNAKEIGTIYLIFAVFAGMIGTAFSVLIRLELSSPGVQFLSGDHQLFNVIISAHAFIMIFFMVRHITIIKYNLIYFYFYFLTFLLTHLIYLNKLFYLFTKWYSEIKEKPLIIKDILVNEENIEKNNFNNFNNFNNSNNSNENNKGTQAPHKYTEIYIKDAFFNRKEIAKFAKNAIGVYVFKSVKGDCYVGSSISLYNRICSYFLPSILIKGDRRVIRYFHNYGFSNIDLTLYILDNNNNNNNLNIKQKKILELEQFFIEKLNPNLNVNLICSSTGFHEPISMEWRQYFRELRGTPIYVYDICNLTLIHIFDSKTYLYRSLHIDHRTLDKYIKNNKPFLSRFIFTLNPIISMSVEGIINISDIKLLFEQIRKDFNNGEFQFKNRKKILAENIVNSNLTKNYISINACVKDLKGDRSTIRKYLENKNNKPYYRGQWKLSYIKN